MVLCPRCGAQNPDNVSLCARCSNMLTPHAFQAAPPPAFNPMAGIEAMVPTKNAPALVAYYLGLFSILPLFGLPMAIVALVQGRKGWLMAKANPQVSGKAHAGIGMGCGSVGLLFNLLIVVFTLIILIEERGKH